MQRQRLGIIDLRRDATSGLRKAEGEGSEREIERDKECKWRGQRERKREMEWEREGKGKANGKLVLISMWSIPQVTKGDSLEIQAYTPRSPRGCPWRFRCGL